MQGTGIETLYQLGRQRYATPSLQTPFVVFSDPVEFKRGRALMEFIRENGLGDVVQTEPLLNPNSNRMLEVYLYSPDDSVFGPWIERENSYKDRMFEIHRMEQLAPGARFKPFTGFKLVPPGIGRDELPELPKKSIINIAINAMRGQYGGASGAGGSVRQLIRHNGI